MPRLTRIPAARHTRPMPCPGRRIRMKAPTAEDEIARTTAVASPPRPGFGPVAIRPRPTTRQDIAKSQPRTGADGRRTRLKLVDIAGSSIAIVPRTLRHAVALKYRYAVVAHVAPLAIRLLGPLEVTVGTRPVVVDTRKALAIVALVAAEGRPFAREELAAMFWPNADDEAARGALRRTLSALRNGVADRGLLIERTRVALDSDSAW